MSQLIAEFTKQAKKGSNRMVDGGKKKKKTTSYQVTLKLLRPLSFNLGAKANTLGPAEL